MITANKQRAFAPVANHRSAWGAWLEIEHVDFYNRQALSEVDMRRCSVFLTPKWVYSSTGTVKHLSTCRSNGFSEIILNSPHHNVPSRSFLKCGVQVRAVHTSSESSSLTSMNYFMPCPNRVIIKRRLLQDSWCATKC